MAITLSKEGVVASSKPPAFHTHESSRCNHARSLAFSQRTPSPCRIRRTPPTRQTSRSRHSGRVARRARVARLAAGGTVVCWCQPASAAESAVSPIGCSSGARRQAQSERAVGGGACRESQRWQARTPCSRQAGAAAARCVAASARARFRPQGTGTLRSIGCSARSETLSRSFGVLQLPARQPPGVSSGAAFADPCLPPQVLSWAPSAPSAMIWAKSTTPFGRLSRWARRPWSSLRSNLAPRVLMPRPRDPL